MARLRPSVLGLIVAVAGGAAFLHAVPAYGAGGPTVSFDTPSSGAAVCGPVAVSGTPVSDPDTGAPVTGVDFTFAGGAPVTRTGPYTTSFDSTAVADGSVTITATASDANGPGPTASEPVTVVNSPRVSVSSPSSGQAVTESVPVTTGGSYDGVAVTGISASVGGEPPVALTAGGGGFTGSVPVSDLTGPQTLTLDVSIGSCSGSQTVPIVVSHPPQVSITAPAGGASVSGNVGLSASASATNGRSVTGVGFFLDDTSHPIGTGALSSGTSASGTWNATWNSTTAGNGSHTVIAVATDNQSVTQRATQTVTVANLGPQVSISAPANGATVKGTVTITAAPTANDGATVSSVKLLDGSSTLATLTASPYSYAWSTAGKNGDHTLTAKMTDSFGRTATSSGVLVHVANPPTATIVSPSAGSTVSGTGVNIAVTATADSSTTVSQVQVKVDGAVLGTASSTHGQYSIAWNTTTLADGPHLLVAHVTDAKGLTADSAAITVNVSNGPDGTTITAPAPGSAVKGTVTITAGADTGAASVAQLTLYDGTTALHTFTAPPFSFAWDTTGRNGTHQLSATVVDTFGRTGAGPAVAVTVANSPTVDITSPAHGDVLAGTVPVRITAASDAGSHVASVQVLLDGAAMGPATFDQGSGQWTRSWDTTGQNGDHTLSAVVTDADGLTASSAPVPVTVSNQGPAIDLSALPDGGAVDRGTVTVTMLITPNAVTGKDVTSVEVDAGATRLSTSHGDGSQWTARWDTSSSLGPQILSVRAGDAGGVTTTAVRHVVVRAPAALSVLAPANAAWGRHTSVSATLRLADGSPLNDRRVTLEARTPRGRTWTGVGTAVTDGAGTARFALSPTRPLFYRASFVGESGVAALTSPSVALPVAPVVVLRFPITAKLGHSVKGLVLVRGPTGSRYRISLHVRIGSTMLSLGTARVPVGRPTPVHLRIARHGKYVVTVTCPPAPGSPGATSNSVTVRA